MLEPACALFFVCAHLGDLGGGLVLGFLDEGCFALLC
jgi:hypothetical protein